MEWTDPYGRIAKPVYETAQQLWPRLEGVAIRLCGDPQLGQQMLMKACVAVTRIQQQEPERIANLAAYLETTWRRLLLEVIAQEKARQQRQHEIPAPLSLINTSERLDQQVLVREIVARMDAWTRTVYEYQVLGHTFEEMSQALGQRGHVIRTKFNKKMKKLMRQIATESRT
jgi:hypothetical protein